MFYLYEGDVCVTPVGETVPEYIEMKKALTKGKDNRLFIDTCTYIFFVYHKEDTLGNKNIFINYPVSERKKIIVEKYDLFKSDSAKRVELLAPVKRFIEFYIKMNYTETERTKDVMREKIDYWRKKYEEIGNSPEDDKDFADAMQLAQKLYTEYEIKAMLEEQGEEEGVDGAPLYLFEIPEHQKPMHIRLKYGDLKNS